MKPFTESMRYEYDLKLNDLVWDVGGYEGNFTAAIFNKFKCHVDVFEPCFNYFMAIRERFPGRSKIRVYNVALSNKRDWITIKLKGDSTGEFADSPEIQNTASWDVAEIVKEIHEVSLLKLNCEGGEFAILERILECGIAEKFKNIAVQFHTCVPDYEKRHDAIREALNKTHNMTFDAPFCWEGWTLK